MSKTSCNNVIADRRDWPRVVYSRPNDRIGYQILEQVRELQWQLVEVQGHLGTLPRDMTPVGAIVKDLPDSPLVQSLLERGWPTVRIGERSHPDDQEVPAVFNDQAAEGRLAAEHFAERGFRHIGYVGNLPWGSGKAVYDALASRASELDLECHILQIPETGALPSPGKSEEKRRQFLDWARALPKPLGMLGHSDRMAARICEWCADGGFAVPRDIAVLGKKNRVITCESALVPLSSIAFDHEQIATQAIRMLQHLVQGNTLEQSSVAVPPRGIIARASTDVLATADPTVAAALEFMWANLAERLPVDRVAAEVGVARRTLERAFRTHLNRGVTEELLRRRIDRSCELLRSTELSVIELAPLVGFGSKDYFQRAFRQAMGTTPGRYRRTVQTHRSSSL